MGVLVVSYAQNIIGVLLIFDLAGGQTHEVNTRMLCVVDGGSDVQLQSTSFIDLFIYSILLI
jgi:hypothetical protein